MAYAQWTGSTGNTTKIVYTTQANEAMQTSTKLALDSFSNLSAAMKRLAEASKKATEGFPMAVGGELHGQRFLIKPEGYEAYQHVPTKTTWWREPDQLDHTVDLLIEVELQKKQDKDE